MDEQQYQQEYIFDEPKDVLELDIANFSGPLDLLLALVKENKIEIKDIFVSQVTEQFLQFMTQVSKLDVDQASEYMAMSATLLEIKSRALLPILPSAEEDENSPEQMLIRQLEEYKLFKEVVTELKTQENVNRFYREPDASVGKEVSVLKDNLSLEGFMTAFSKFLAKMQVKAQADVSRAITKENFSVGSKIALIREVLRNEEQFKFVDLFPADASKNEIITTFMAVLELLKLQAISVEQNGLFEEVIIHKKGDMENIDIRVGDEYDEQVE